jgi:hypothetical protein
VTSNGVDNVTSSARADDDNVTLQRVEYFRDLPHGDPGSAGLRESPARPLLRTVGDRGLPHSRKRPGDLTEAGPRCPRCHGSTDRHTSDPADGTWELPSDLAPYVREHHVSLPADFVRHMVSRNWEVPRLSEEGLLELLDEG